MIISHNIIKEIDKHLVNKILTLITAIKIYYLTDAIIRMTKILHVNSLCTVHTKCFTVMIYIGTQHNKVKYPNPGQTEKWELNMDSHIIVLLLINSTTVMIY